MAFAMLLLFICLLGFESAWTQHNIACRVKQSRSIGVVKERLLTKIIDTLQEIADHLIECPSTSTTEQQPQLGSRENPAQSCNAITENRSSGLYWIQANNASSPVQVYCNTDPRNCSCNCNNTGGWARVANIDMKDPNQTCPDGYKLISTPRRSCGKPDDLSGCQSTTFPVHGIKYSRVCGRIIGYQVGRPDGFWGFIDESQNIDGHYISGVSLTHGSPRQHIWSFVNTVSDGFSSYDRFICPCSRNDGSTYTGTVPSFMGNDYFCDSGIEDNVDSGGASGIFYPDDPLWDGAGCGGTSTCCKFNNPPWFCKQLPQPTTDDIEFRLCENSTPNQDDSPFELVELYIH